MTEIENGPGAAEIADVTKVTASQTSIAGRIRNYFLTGLIVEPMAITVWLIWSLINWVDGFVTPIIPPAYGPESYLPWPIPGTGLIIAVVALTLLGFLPQTSSDVPWSAGVRHCSNACRSCARSIKQ